MESMSEQEGIPVDDVTFEFDLPCSSRARLDLIVRESRALAEVQSRQYSFLAVASDQRQELAPGNG